MGRRRLTIAIPTFNRAELLERQLAWLARALRGHEESCEVIVSDNASPDGTDAVVRRRLAALHAAGVSVRHYRQPDNVGAIRNIAHCIKSAHGDYVWTVSDDDELADDAVARVLSQLETFGDLSLLVLNFSTRHHRTGRRKFERCFENSADEVADDGAALFEKYLADPNPSRWGGLALTTALVYRSSTARAALASWPAGLDNLALQLHVSGYCARRGRMLVTGQPLLEMIGGRHFFEEDRRFFALFRYAQVPEAFLRLIGDGYSPSLLRRKIVEVRHEVQLPLVASLLWRSPGLLAAIGARYLYSLLRALHREHFGRGEPARAPELLPSGQPE